MIVGLISDAHGLLPPEVLKLFRQVDHILYAGDAVRPEVLSDLATLAPLDAVWGNVDGPDVRTRAKESVRVDLGGVRFAMAHGHLVSPRFDLLLDEFPDADVIVHGHSHRPRLDRVAGRWLVNPGAARSPRGGSPPSVALAEIRDGGVRFSHLALPDGRRFTP